jgi:hypothetical protein
VPVRATNFAHLISPNLTTISMFCGHHKPWKASLSSFVLFPVTCSLVDPRTFLNTLFSNICCLCTRHTTYSVVK